MGTGSWGTETGSAPGSSIWGCCVLVPLLLLWYQGDWVVSPWNQAEAHNFVSGPAACKVGKESRIFATSMAHRCPKTLLYQSGERPLRSARQIWVSRERPRPQGSMRYWEVSIRARTPDSGTGCSGSRDWDTSKQPPRGRSERHIRSTTKSRQGWGAMLSVT